jgi:Tfp pilus assembly protein PilV
MSLFERLLAALVLALCVAGLVHLCLPARWKVRVEARWRRIAATLGRPWQRWRARRERPASTTGAGDADAARREAQAAIHRARTAARRDGNVIHPERFRRPRRPH